MAKPIYAVTLEDLFFSAGDASRQQHIARNHSAMRKHEPVLSLEEDQAVSARWYAAARLLMGLKEEDYNV